MDAITAKIQMLFRSVRQDPQYAALRREYDALETQLGQLAQKLPQQEQDLIWAFLCASDGMNWRMLEYLCEQNVIQ